MGDDPITGKTESVETGNHGKEKFAYSITETTKSKMGYGIHEIHGNENMNWSRLAMVRAKA